MAQHFKDDVFLQKSVDNAPIIVEGKVVEQTTLMHENNIYTKSKIKIYKTFKGDLKEPYFYLLHSGGAFDDIVQTCSHCFELGSKAEGLFFLKPPNEGVAKGRSNTFSYLESGPTSFVYYMKDSLNLNTIANSRDYTYTHIERGLLQKIEDRIGKKRLRLAFTEDEERLMNKMRNRGLNPTGPEDYDGLEYRLQQPNILFEQGQQFLSFDVFLKSYSSLNLDYQMLQSAITVDYAGDLLPQNIIAQNIISIIKSSGFQSSDYQTELLDLTGGKAYIGLEAPLTSLNLHEISDIFEKMCQVKINLTNLNPLGTVRARFDENQMLDDNRFRDVSAAEPFDFVIAEDSLVGSVSNFLPIDYDFTPKVVTAGTFDGNDIITITGANLGDITNCEEPPIIVTYRDAFNGGTRWSEVKNFLDYVEWGVVANSNPSKHYVKVRVPGSGADDGGITTYPGSGKIKVKFRNGTQETVSSEDLTIKYCLRTSGTGRLVGQISGCKARPNYIYGGTVNGAVPVKMVDASSNNSGCYVIKFDPSFNTRAGAKAAFTRALNRWRCSTGINFVINDNLTNQTGYDVLISFGTADPFSSATLANTRRDEQNCFNMNGENTGYTKGFTIVFKSDHTWNYGDNLNFETNALHELGHAHLILHTNSPSDLMFWLASASNIGNNDAEASRFMVIRSRTSSGGGCNSGLIPVPASTCRTNNNDISGQSLHFSVYPNPTQLSITIDIPNFDYKEIKITVVNAQGEIIYAQKRLTNQVRLETDNWATGLYCITLSQGSKVATKKILKQ
jgi:hypothetical protein